MEGFSERIRLDGVTSELAANVRHVVLLLLSGGSSRGRITRSPLFPDGPFHADVERRQGNATRVFRQVAMRIQRWARTSQKPYPFFVRTGLPRQARAHRPAGGKTPVNGFIRLYGLPIGPTIYLCRDSKANAGLWMVGVSQSPGRGLCAVGAA